MKVFGRIRGPFSMLLHSPKLALRTNRVDQATFDALRKRYSAQWLVELTAAASYFVFVSRIANAFEVPAPPDGDKLT
jgi:alkylhydroperoxidase family enzyme